MDAGYKVVFLTNNPISQTLVDWLRTKCVVVVKSNPITLEEIEAIQPQLLLSYNYSYIVKPDVLDYMKGHSVNMHVSFLPWNKGADPNFWSFVDDTPKGVTIHQMSPGLDTGAIMYQETCDFDPQKETFASSYQTLQETIQELFKQHWDEIKSYTAPLHPQTRIGSLNGSYHVHKEFLQVNEKIPFGWDMRIADYISQYKRYYSIATEEEVKTNYDRKLAIITARGTDRLIPSKNIKVFCGKPIIAYTIRAALESGIFDEVMVSTESREVAECAMEYGASVPFLRSTELTAESVSGDEIVKEVLQTYEAQGRIFDWVCCMYPTAPFITAQKIKSAFQILLKSGASSVLPVTEYTYHPSRCMYESDGRIWFKNEETINKETVDLEPLYRDAGQFVFTNVAKFKSAGSSRIKGETVPFYLTKMEVEDIHTLNDWKIAEFKYGIYKSLYLRKATKEDMGVLYNWRIEESKSESGITYEGFVSRCKQYTDDGGEIYLFIRESQPIGWISISDHCLIDHFYIDRAQRNKGFGKSMIRLSENELLQKAGSDLIKAVIENTDIASHKVFKSLGYIGKENGNTVEYTKSFRLQEVGNQPT